MSERPYILDASALFAGLAQEPGAEVVYQMLPRARISVVNLAEVISKFRERGITEAYFRERFAHSEVKVSPLSVPQAYLAASFRPLTRSVGLSLSDRCCLSLAKLCGGIAVTADTAWASVADTLAVRVHLLRPRP